ncbi:MAG: CehA/McbA family metallohydrolase [Myxococcota bacterium]
MRRALALAFVLLGAPTLAEGQEPDLVLEGVAPAGPERFVFVPFDVPEGTREIVFEHRQVLEENILDFGLNGPDPEGLSGQSFRGWGGSNADDTLIATAAATPGYLPGPLAGRWELVVGLAKVDVAPAPYRVALTFRDADEVAACVADASCVTLPEVDPDRGPYVPAEPLAGAGWYAGDLHVHSVHSGDATPTLDEIAAYAASIGLQWIEVSEHNTTSHVGMLSAVQRRHPEVLLVPGIEWTTYQGHANAIGLTTFVDHKIGSRGVTMEGSLGAIRETGAVLAPVHPLIGIGDLCIGCDWDTDLGPALVDALEIVNGDVDGVGFARLERNLALWDEWCDEGRHVVAIGGSDSHRAGERGPTISPIGEPTTLVEAEALDAEGILAGLRGGRTVVKLGGPDDPMAVLEAVEPREGDTVVANEATFRVRVSDGGGARADALVFVVDGVADAPTPIPALPFEAERTLTAPESAEARVRVEVLSEGRRRTVTSHLWLRRPAPVMPDLGPPDAGADAGAAEGGGGCAAGPAPLAAGLALLAFASARRRRR